MSDRTMSNRALPVIGHPALPQQAALVVLGTLVLALSSYIAIPLAPVPITMQTLAVTLIGAIYGPRLGAITVAAWLAEAAAGMPVLAGGHAGLPYMMGPTAGYLAAFPVVAFVTGWLCVHGAHGRRPILAFGAMALGNLVCLGIGAGWLATLIGVPAAVASGVTPFLLGAGIKSAMGAAILWGIAATRRHR